MVDWKASDVHFDYRTLCRTVVEVTTASMLHHSQRAAVLIVLAAFITTLVLLRLTASRETIQQRLTQAVGLGEYLVDEDQKQETDSGHAEVAGVAEVTPNVTEVGPSLSPSKPSFVPGASKGSGYEFSRILVVPRMRRENVDWLKEELPDLQTAIYVADDPNAPLHPPENKGHEVMIYFTYIIDNYDNLPDIMMFMHAHRHAWHNNELFAFDAAEMIRRLSSERVHREGYMNMRCHWNPGCPSWMHPGRTDEDLTRPEEPIIAKAWSELFPGDPIPLVLGQACCSQIALSRDRVHSIPKSTYVFYRDWLLRTDLEDSISGRVWEYLWQYVFTGNNTYCPEQSVCYCDGYGVCFGGEDQFEEYYRVRVKKTGLEKQLNAWQVKATRIAKLRHKGKLDESANINVPELGKDVQLEQEIGLLQQDMDLRFDQALIRGQDPKARAHEAGREWHDGDGF